MKSIHILFCLVAFMLLRVALGSMSFYSAFSVSVWLLVFWGVLKLTDKIKD